MRISESCMIKQLLHCPLPIFASKNKKQKNKKTKTNDAIAQKNFKIPTERRKTVWQFKNAAENLNHGLAGTTPLCGQNGS